jgi:hypothetical protein
MHCYCVFTYFFIFIVIFALFMLLHEITNVGCFLILS